RRTDGCRAVANRQGDHWALYFPLSLCCVAILFEPIAGTSVDGKYPCSYLFSPRLSLAVSSALCVAWSCSVTASTVSKLAEDQISNFTSAFSGYRDFRVQLSWTIDRAERCETRHRLEVTKGIPVTPGEHPVCQSCRQLHCACQVACTDVDSRL